MPARFCLDLHARYACRHAGVCCESGWPIPLEPRVLAVVSARSLGRRGTVVHQAGPAGIALAGRGADGACAFYDREHGRLCSIHRTAGEAALPSACRHFPRVPLHDDRGTFVTLSCVCPTAARLLLEPAALAIVAAPASIAFDGMEGFEARGALPPLLREGVLTDLEGYAAWEAAAVRTLARRDLGAGTALAVVARATGIAAAWSPGQGTLAARVRAAFDEAHGDAVPGPVVVHPAAGVWLATRVFANRVAYRGRGLSTIVQWLARCLDVLREEARSRQPLTDDQFVAAAGAADLRILHAADETEPC